MPPAPNRQKPTSAKPSVPSKSGGVLDRLPSMWGGNYIKALVYGESGSGKTTFWATAPGQTLVIIASGSAEPGEMKSIDTPENRKRIHPKMPSTMAEVRELISVAQGFDNVVLDHATGLADMDMREILGIDEMPTQKSWGMASQQQYGTNALHMKETFRALLNLPCNVFIVAQQRVFKATEDGSTDSIIAPTVGAALSPSVVGWLNPACDYILQTYKRTPMVERQTNIGGKIHTSLVKGKGVEYVLRCEPHETFTTKFRIPKGRHLPEGITDPTFAKLLAVIAGDGE